MNGYGIRYIYPKMPLMHSCIKSRWVAEKILWVTAYQQGKSISQISREAHMSRKAIRKWLTRFKEGGISALVPKKPGARTGTHPSALGRNIVIRILSLYGEKDYGNYGIRSIVHLLAKEGINLSHMTVYRYLVARGKITPQHKKRRRIPKLHVCDIPGEEVQLDVMHVDPIPGTEKIRQEGVGKVSTTNTHW